MTPDRASFDPLKSNGAARRGVASKGFGHGVGQARHRRGKQRKRGPALARVPGFFAGAALIGKGAAIWALRNADLQAALIRQGDA